MKIIAIVQARVSSTRLRGKVLQTIGRFPMYLEVLNKVSLIFGGEDCHVILAIPEDEQFGFPFRWPQVVVGPHDDVLARFVQVANKYEADAFVRFTADCPLLDVGYSQHLIGLFHYLQEEREFGIAPELLATSPYLDGLDTEIFTRHALMEANDNARGTDREHVTSWMRRHIPTQIVTMPLLGGPIRWSVDDESGLDFVRRVYAACPHCALAVPHHTNASSSIGGADRSLVLDLHTGEGGGLVECMAADILRERIGPQWKYDSLSS